MSTDDSTRAWHVGKITVSLMVAGLLCAASGCTSQASNPYINAGQTVRLDGTAHGIPASGAVRIGLGGQGLYLQPSVYMRQIQLWRK